MSDMGRLVYVSEEGKVRFDTGFKSTPDDVVKLDILRDWIVALDREYNRVHAITFPKTPKGKRK